MAQVWNIMNMKSFRGHALFQAALQICDHGIHPQPSIIRIAMASLSLRGARLMIIIPSSPLLLRKLLVYYGWQLLPALRLYARLTRMLNPLPSPTAAPRAWASCISAAGRPYLDGLHGIPSFVYKTIVMAK